MNLRLIFSGAAAGLILLACSCHKPAPTNSAKTDEQTERDQHLVSSELVNPAETQLCRLGAKWQVGSRYIYRMQMDQHRTNRTDNLAAPIDEEIQLGLTYALTVAEETSDSGHELELEFLANDLEIKVKGESVIHFSASKNATNLTDQPVPAPFRKMIGSTVLLRVAGNGRVEKVLGHELWLKTVAGDASGPAGQMVLQQFTEEFFKQLADFGRGLPARQVKPGDTWPNRDEVPAADLGKIVMTSTVSLAKWEEHDERQLALLSASGNLHSEPCSQATSTPMSIEHGQVTGKTWFDPAGGMLVESLVEEVLQVKGSIPSSSSATVPTQFTSDIVQKVSVKLVELGKAVL